MRRVYKSLPERKSSTKAKEKPKRKTRRRKSQDAKVDMTPDRGKDVLAWVKRWKPQWESKITFPQNTAFQGLFEKVNSTDELDATIIDGNHRLLLRFDHTYDSDGFAYSAELPEINSTLEIKPFKIQYGRLRRKHQFNSIAESLVAQAKELVEQIPSEHQGNQIRQIGEVMEILNFPEEIIEVTRETLFGNPDPEKHHFLTNPVSFLNLENGWLVVPDKETVLKLNLEVEYEHVFRLDYHFDQKLGPLVEDFQKYELALARLPRQTIRRVFSLLGKYTSIVHNPFFSDISQRFPVRYVALNNGLLVTSLSKGSTWDKGTFEFYQRVARRE